MVEKLNYVGMPPALLQELMAYLVLRPYAEVSGIIEQLNQECIRIDTSAQLDKDSEE